MEYPLTGDPLWPALARHLTRRATDDDRALLTDLAQHPERREPPLSWGLQFIVRGDVLLEDGSVLLLDDLTDKAGLPRLPYLEEMPDELEVDWDAESRSEPEDRRPYLRGLSRGEDGPRCAGRPVPGRAGFIRRNP